MKTITIEVQADGSLKIDANGFQDAMCLESLKDLESLFGKAENVRMKPEARRNVERIKTNRVKN